MLIEGEWLASADAAVRPILRAGVLGADGLWQPAPFLLDTGADCTVLSASVLVASGLSTQPPRGRLGGVGGFSDWVIVDTQLRLRTDAGGFAVFRGEYGAFTSAEALDMSVIGRDILDLFAVIVDRPGDSITLLTQKHSYAVVAK